MMINQNTEKKIFITLDLDWVTDFVLEEILELIEVNEIKVTIFVTHSTELLKRMRTNSNIELGVHPNFIPKTYKDLEKYTYDDFVKNILSEYVGMIPEARSIRTHGLVYSSKLLMLFQNMGFTHESNLLMPLSSNMPIAAYKHWNSVIGVPILWEDDIHCLEVEAGTYSDWNCEKFFSSNQIKVFNFHPLHLFLNTENLSRYDRAKVMNNKIDIIRMQNRDQSGVRTFFEDLIKYAKENGYYFSKMNEI